MSETTIPIPARLKNVAVGGHVCGADDVDFYKEASTGTSGSNPYNGLGKVVFEKNMVNYVNTLTQDMFYKGEAGSRVPNTDTVFVIKYDFTLGEDITVPANCVLEFDGGSISGGNLNLTNTLIDADDKCFENITFQGTIKNDDVHVKWFGNNLSMNDLQTLFNFALSIKKDVNFDGLTVTFTRKIEINNLMVHQPIWWWTIKNGTIICDTANTQILFTADETLAGDHYTGYPTFSGFIFEDIKFVNLSVIENMPTSEYEYEICIYSEWLNSFNYQTDGSIEYYRDHPYVPRSTKARLIEDNRIARVTCNNCTFNGISLIEEHRTNGSFKYHIQSYYINGCRIQNMEYDFIDVIKAYDTHFTNNAVEHSYRANILNITTPIQLIVTDNLIQAVMCAVRFGIGLSVTVCNNYFECCGSHVVEQYSIYQHNTFVFTGNSCIQGRTDLVSNGPAPDYAPGEGEYHYLHTNGIIKGFDIQGNNFHIQSFDDGTSKARPAYTVIAAWFNNSESDGTFIPTKNEECMIIKSPISNVKKVTKNITGDPDKSILAAGPGGTVVPVGGLSADMGKDGHYDSRIPALGDAHRIIVDLDKVRYTLKKRNEEYVDLFDYVWRTTLVDANAPYIPWTYVKRQLAEDNLAVLNGDLNPSIPADLAKYQSPWVRQCLMLDSQTGNDYLDINLGKVGSRMDFTAVKGYYDGLMRFNPSEGIQFWNFDRWCDAEGFDIETKKFGSTSERPFSVFKITSFTPVNYIINGSGKYVASESSYSSLLIDVSSYKNRLMQINSPNCYIAFLSETPIAGESVKYAEGYSSVVSCNSNLKFILPKNVEYLYIVYNNGGTIYTINSINIVEEYLPSNHIGGFQYFDTTINKPIWFSGNVFIGDDGWVDINGDNPSQS